MIPTVTERDSTAITCFAFLCYRQADGKEAARWLFGHLHGHPVVIDGKPGSMEVYFDQTTAGIGNWHELHQAHLERARAMLVVISPGMRSDFRVDGEDDWVHYELDWWIKTRRTAPVVIDTTGDARFIPPQLRRRWPDVQRIDLRLSELSALRPAELAERTEQILARIVGGIEQSEVSVLHEDLEASRRLTRRLRNVLVAAGVLLLVTIALAFLAANSASRARVERSRANRERASVLRLSSFRELRDLRERSIRFGPLSTFPNPQSQAWLMRATALVASLDAAPDGGPGHLAVRESLAHEPDLETGMDHEGRRWWLEQLDSLISDIQSFSAADTGYVDGRSPELGWGIRRREIEAGKIDRQTRSSVEARSMWEDVNKALRESRIYGDLSLSPQFGLVPLGTDPGTHFLEFVDVTTGSTPTRDHEGHLEIAPDAGIVFVLLPGGRFLMGSTSEETAARVTPNLSERDELPRHSETLAPFLISKYELTQSQWIKMTGSNPSALNPDNHEPRVREILKSMSYTPRLPVESISWWDAKRILEQFDDRLPTEIEWEYACRGGTETTWWTGDDIGSLSFRENLADLSICQSMPVMASL